MHDFAELRHNMVNSQLRPNKISDALLLRAFTNIPRENFVPEKDQTIAYADEYLSLGHDRYLFPPVLLGQLIQSLEIQTCDRVLDIGCGAGYAATILGYLAKSVVALEEVDALAQKTLENVSQGTVSNVESVVGPLKDGWPKAAPYDVIFIETLIPSVPAEILSQLADQGRLVAILQQSSGSIGSAVLFRRQGTNMSQALLWTVNHPAMKKSLSQPRFHFG